MDRLIGFDPQLLADAAITGINILILFFVLSYLLFDPVRTVLQKRRDRIAGELSDAADKQAEATRLKEEYEAKMKEAGEQADAIIEDARKKAKVREAEIVDEARAEAGRIVDRANKEVELERKKAIASLKDDVVDIASLVAARAVGGSMTPSVQSELVDETLREMGDGTWQN